MYGWSAVRDYDGRFFFGSAVLNTDSLRRGFYLKFFCLISHKHVNSVDLFEGLQRVTCDSVFGHNLLKNDSKLLSTIVGCCCRGRMVHLVFLE